MLKVKFSVLGAWADMCVRFSKIVNVIAGPSGRTKVYGYLFRMSVFCRFFGFCFVLQIKKLLRTICSEKSLFGKTEIYTFISGIYSL